MEPKFFDLTQIKCDLSNQTIQSHVGYAPYLFVCTCDGGKWYDGKKLEENAYLTLKKIRLFTVFNTSIFSLGVINVSDFNRLYVYPKKEFYKRVEDKSAVLTALFYHYQADKVLFNKIRSEAGINRGLAFLVGQVLLSSATQNEKAKGISFLIDCAKHDNNTKAAQLAAKALLKGDFTTGSKFLQSDAISLLEKVPDNELKEEELILMLAKTYLDFGDKDKAKFNYLKVAKEGNPTACYEYAKLLLDENEQLEWYLKASLHSKRHPLAAYEAALILQKRDQDRPLLRTLMLQAAASGNKEAAYQAGWMCKAGVGGDVDLEAALNLFLESAKEVGGSAYLQIGLIYMEMNGDSLQKAKEAFKQAQSLGNREVQKYQKELEEKISKNLDTEKYLIPSSSSKTISSSSSSRKKSIVDLADRSRQNSLSNEEISQRSSHDSLSVKKVEGIE